LDAFTLYELNEHIRRVIALNFQEPIWVRCEISQVKSSRGHYYLDLVEKIPDGKEVRAQANAVIWSKTAWFIRKKLQELFGQILQEGMEVRLKVRVDFHERFGLKLIIDDVDPTYTLGNIEAQRRQIVETLHAEGMIGLNGQLPLPVVLQRIAVLSAPHAAGYHDFRKHLLHNPWQFRFWTDLYPIAVQGVLVEAQLLEALRKVARVRHHYDCVVVIRGGGSRMDLSAFDSLEIGRAIARFPLPVFTGIGHEIDTTVADAVAHTSLKTPTAVAAFILEVNGHYDTTITQVYRQIADNVARSVAHRHTALSHLAEMLRRAPREALLRRRMELDNITPALLAHSRHFITTQKDRLAYMQELLVQVDPDTILERGYSITTLQGKRLRSASQVSAGDTIISHLHEGRIQSIVTEHE
jgi:exodeoxyribonuclease VII large subunit